MREYVCPMIPVGIRCGGGDTATRKPIMLQVVRHLHRELIPTKNSPTMKKQPSVGLGTVTGHPTHTHSGVGRGLQHDKTEKVTQSERADETTTC